MRAKTRQWAPTFSSVGFLICAISKGYGEKGRPLKRKEQGREANGTAQLQRAPPLSVAFLLKSLAFLLLVRSAVKNHENVKTKWNNYEKQIRD